MSNQENFILDGIDPDVGDRIVASRRDVFANTAS